MPLQMRLPKFGFSSRISRVTAEVRLSELNGIDSDIIDIEALKKANIITTTITRAKVMLSGEVTRAVTLRGIAVTKGARAAIEAAGGKILEAGTDEPTQKVTAKDKPAAKKSEEKPDQDKADVKKDTAKTAAAKKPAAKKTTAKKADEKTTDS